MPEASPALMLMFGCCGSAGSRERANRALGGKKQRERAVSPHAVRIEVSGHGSGCWRDSPFSAEQALPAA